MTTKTKNDPVFFIDTERLNTSKSEMLSYCETANVILNKLAELQVNTPENKDEAINLIYSGTDKIREIITAQQIEKMSALPIVAAQKLVSLPITALNSLNQIMYAFQNKGSIARINKIDFLLFSNGQFQPDFEKLERNFTTYRTGSITEAETLCNDFIQAFERLKLYCSEHGYPGSAKGYGGLLGYNSTLDNFEIQPEGFKYFPV